MKYIVTGGAGFIGSNIVKKLVARGHKVTVIDNLNTGKEENLELVVSTCIDHIKLLIEKGIGNFKQTIEKLHYWGEGTVYSKLLKPIYDDRILILDKGIIKEG